MKRQPVVPPCTFRIFPGGVTCIDSVAADLVLVRHDQLLAKGIRGFERIRVPKEFCWTNHACTVLEGGPNARVTQMEAHGDLITSMSKLDAVTYAVVHFEATDEQRKAAVDFAAWAVHLGYGFAQIPADAFNCVTGLELTLGAGDRMVCSTQATRTLERLGLIPDRSPYAVIPAHLAMWTGTKLSA